MNTRTERIGTIEYCAYCGKSLRNYDCGFAIYPGEPMICNCEKAKEELDLYKRLKDLYNVPLAESLIDKKVQKYRNDLLGIKEPTYIDSITAVNINPINQGEIDVVFA